MHLPFTCPKMFCIMKYFDTIAMMETAVIMTILHAGNVSCYICIVCGKHIAIQPVYYRTTKHAFATLQEWQSDPGLMLLCRVYTATDLNANSSQKS